MAAEKERTQGQLIREQRKWLRRVATHAATASTIALELANASAGDCVDVFRLRDCLKWISSMSQGAEWFAEALRVRVSWECNLCAVRASSPLDRLPDGWKIETIAGRRLGVAHDVSIPMQVLLCAKCLEREHRKRRRRKLQLVRSKEGAGHG